MLSEMKGWQALVIMILLTACTIGAFRQINKCDFINYDDPDYVTQNVNVQHGLTLESIRWAFTTGHTANWHPVTWLSHMLDVQLFGFDPGYHHLINLLFHIANTLLLFFVFNRMTKSPWKSAFVAALFALHPLHVESVAWVAERKNVLSTSFWMLTMLAYTYYVERHDGIDPFSRLEAAPTHDVGSLCGTDSSSRLEAAPTHGVGSLCGTDSSSRLEAAPTHDVGSLRGTDPFSRLEAAPTHGVGSLRTSMDAKEGFLGLFSDLRYLAVLIFFILGLMAKPMLVTLPFVLILLDYWPLKRFDLHAGFAASRRSIKRIILEKIPFLALSALSCVITIAAQQRAGTVESFDILPLRVRMANALVSYVIYVRKAVWPNDLAILYPHPGFRPMWQVLGAAAFLMAITGFVILRSKRSPYLAFGWLWFTGTLVPVIGVVQVGIQALADRYTYVPLIGLFIMAAWGIPELLPEWRCKRIALFASSVSIVLCLAIATFVHVRYWQNSISLYDHTLSVTDRNSIVYNNRGLAHHNLGNFRQGIADYDRAIEINPRYSKAFNNRGVAYFSLGDTKQAISDFDCAVLIASEFAEAYNNRGVAYNTLGAHAEAIGDFDRAIALNSGYAKAYYNRGLAWANLGREDQAVEDFKASAKLDCREAKSLLIKVGIKW